MMSDKQVEVTCNGLTVPPPYTASAPVRAWSKRLAIAWVYGGVVTTALVVVLILGGLYIHEKRMQTNALMPEATQKDGNVQMRNNVETFNVNTETTVIIKDRESDNVTTVGVFQHDTGYAGFYMAEKNECWVASGSRDIIAQWFQPRESKDAASRSDIWAREEIEFRPDYGMRARFADLPKKLQTMCAGMPVYAADVHIQPKGYAVAESRQKRRAAEGITLCCCACLCGGDSCCCVCACVHVKLEVASEARAVH